MYPFTLQTEIMRHMLVFAKSMASAELVQSPARNSTSTRCVVTQLYLTTSCEFDPFRTGCGAMR